MILGKNLANLSKKRKNQKPTNSDHIIRINYLKFVGLTEYLKLFLRYVKARAAPTYTFPIATLFSIIVVFPANIEISSAIVAIIISYFLALGAYVYNDLTDIDVDKINNTKRPSTENDTNKKKLVVLVSLIFGSSILCSVFINNATLIISSIYVALGIMYSNKKFSLKNKFSLKTLTTAAGAGLLSLIGGTSQIGMDAFVSIQQIFISSVFFLYYFILAPLGDIGDIKGDRKGGRKTFPIIIGIRGTMIIIISIPMIIICLLYYAYNNIQINIIGLWLSIASCGGIFYVLYTIFKKIDNIKITTNIRNIMRYLNIVLQCSIMIMLI